MQVDLFGAQVAPVGRSAASKLKDRIAGGEWLLGMFCATEVLPWRTARGEETAIWVFAMLDHWSARFSKASPARLRAIEPQLGETKEDAALALAIVGDA